MSNVDIMYKYKNQFFFCIIECICEMNV